MPSSATGARGLLARIEHARPEREVDPKTVLNSIGEVVYNWNLVSDQLDWGPNAADILGNTGLAGIRTGTEWTSRLAPEAETSRQEAILRSGSTDAGTGVRYQLHYALRPAGRDGAVVWVEDTGRWFAGSDGKPAKAHGVIRLQQDAPAGLGSGPSSRRFDPLTGTISRGQLVDYLGRVFTTSSRARRQFAFMLVSIENLPAVNRSHGYEAGDRLVIAVADRLRANLRSTDAIARFAGNKFALVLDQCDTEQMSAAAHRCLRLVTARPVETGSGPVPIALRIGGAIAPRQARDYQALFMRAEEALAGTREPDAPPFLAFEPEMSREAARQRRQRISDEIVAAVNGRRIEIALEPIVDARTHRPICFEALLRLRLENGTILPPAEIIPTAEETGLITMIDQHVLDLAAARLTADPALHLSVNMSSATIRDPGWPAHVEGVLALHPGTATRLTLEMTETCAIVDLEATRRTIEALRRLGVKIAMDDFGAGHTSFRNLRVLGIDLLKIDGAFIQNLARSVDDRFFVRTLVELARHLGIPTVAEWVEDAETARLLLDWGIDYFQGSLFEAEPELAAAPAAEADRAA